MYVPGLLLYIDKAYVKKGIKKVDENGSKQTIFMVKSIKINHFKRNRYQKTILYQKEKAGDCSSTFCP